MIFDNYKPNYLKPNNVENVSKSPNVYNVRDNLKPTKKYSSLEKLDDYLYSIKFEDDFDYKFANDYFSTELTEKYPNRAAQCSAVRKGNYYGRNFDWYYDEEVGFLMETTKTENRLASIGVGGYFPTITKQKMKEDMDSISLTEWKLLPFRLLDGINEKGVFCSNNVVPAGDLGITTGTNFGVKPELSMVALTRFILDHCETADSAIDYIKNKLSIYSRKLPQLIETHYFIGDSNKTYIVEFQNNETIVKEYEKPFMTNFYQNIEGLIDEDNVVDYSKSTPHGNGFERWKIIANKYDSLTSLESFKTLMRNDLKYTNAYRETVTTSEGKWYSEFIGNYAQGDLTVKRILIDEDEIRDTVYDNIAEQFKTATRDGKFWQSCHSSVYDLENKKLYLVVQENTEKEFTKEFSI